QQQASMLNRLDNMEQQQVSMLNRLDSMEQQQVSMLKRQESMEKRQDEIFSIVKAIEHSNLVRKAEIDNLTHKVAKIEGVITGIGKVIQKSAI
ncbi:MAG: M domain protein, partial [Epulopiscium sp.]|nr:M domain protein [Candidatus Epulonipiscium sp.]